MSARVLLVPAALLLLACQPGADEEPLELGQVIYQTPGIYDACSVDPVALFVSGRVADTEAHDKSAAAEGQLFVTVTASPPTNACAETATSTPARAVSAVFLDPQQRFSLDASGFAVDGEPPLLHVRAFIDENGDGVCSDGEPSGAAEVTGDDCHDIVVALSRSGA